MLSSRDLGELSTTMRRGKSNGRQLKSCVGLAFNSKLGRTAILCIKCIATHTATSRVETSRQVSSCQPNCAHAYIKF